MMTKTRIETPELSVADRVLKTFVEHIAQDDLVSDTATRLESVLIGPNSITETALREALFNEKSK
jgi:monomeric isocitrate dehydrogenase